jgi:hypothetical protein
MSGEAASDLTRRCVAQVPSSEASTPLKLPALLAELTRFSWYGPVFCEARLCLVAGLRWPFSSKERRASEWTVLARRRRKGALDRWTEPVPVSASESDSGTVPRAGSFLPPHEHRPPWLQQQVSV